MDFQVRALKSGQVISLDLVAASETDARNQMLQTGLQILSIQPHSKAQWFALFRKNRNNSDRFSLTHFTEELLALLDAGLGIFESLSTLHDKESHPFTKSLLASILDRLKEGKKLSAAFADFPHIFPSLYVNIIRTAEQTSNLQASMRRYLDYQTRLDTIRGKLTSAAIYPCILFAVGSAVTFFLLGYVVPRFASVYEGTHQSLPFLSELLLQWGKWIAAHPAIAGSMLAFLVSALIAGIAALRRNGRWIALVQMLPGMKEKLHTYHIARMYMTLGMLLQGGMPFVQALDLVCEILPPSMKKSARNARARIAEGAPISTTLEQFGLITVVAMRMIRVGEQSGQLGEMMIRSAQFMDGDISRWIDRFSRVFEPVLMTVIGLIVGLVVVLLYMPIFDLAGSLQ